MDKLNREQRHRCMANIRSKNTKPELLVRKFLFSRGFRYRIHHYRLPGQPDIVLRKYRTVIFINGCFWHGHEDCQLFKLPQTNTEFWKLKIKRNQERDTQTIQRIAQMGWHYITIWECQLKPKVRQQTLDSLEYTLHHIYLQDRTCRTYKYPTQEQEDVAAEENSTYTPRCNNK